MINQKVACIKKGNEWYIGDNVLDSQTFWGFLYGIKMLMYNCIFLIVKLIVIMIYMYNLSQP